jgi:3-deoxy-manno-octulosonate cytidylyltransferase (CMP-KDO synthetase)
MKKRVVAIIPSRLESSRLPRKALADICGLPMIVHVYKRCVLADSLDDVYVATDNEEIKEQVERCGGKVIMTDNMHKTGTDRIAEAAKNIDAEIIVNIQGDEALVNPDHINDGVLGLIDSEAKVSILLTNFSKKKSYGDIKAVVNLKKEIMYFSRNDIPSDSRVDVSNMLKAYHVVSFKKDFLMKYTSLRQTPLEKIEYNEYLRILENGYKIQGVYVKSDAISVDTQSDLDYVIKKMKKDKLFNNYKNKV